MSIQALREQRAAIANKLRDHVKKADWKADVDQPIYDQMMAEHDDLEARIANMENVNRLAVENAERDGIIIAAERLGRDKGDEAGIAFAKFLRGEQGRVDAAELTAIRNTMSTGVGAEGGFTVQTEVSQRLLDALKAFGGMRSVADVMQMAQGNPLSFPASDGTAEEGELLAENATATALDPTFSSVSLPVYKFSSKIIAVPIELLQDSTIDVEAFVRNRIVQRLGRITNKLFTIGTGASQPNGIVTASAAGRVGTSGQTLNVIYDDLVELEHSVDPAYREGGDCGFMMADSSLKVVKKLKDLEGRPIFLPAYDLANSGKLASILGYAVTINQSVAAMAANAKSILFGDFNKYVIRDVLDVSMMRFTDSVYMTKGQVAFLAFMRSGGNLADVGGAVKYYQNSAT